MNTLKMPDITLAQILAGIAWALGQGVSMGLIDNDTNQYVLSLATTAVTAAWVLADAVIRHGRSRALQVPPRPPTEGDAL